VADLDDVRFERHSHPDHDPPTVVLDRTGVTRVNLGDLAFRLTGPPTDVALLLTSGGRELGRFRLSPLTKLSVPWNDAAPPSLSPTRSASPPPLPKNLTLTSSTHLNGSLLQRSGRCQPCRRAQDVTAAWAGPRRRSSTLGSPSQAASSVSRGTCRAA
jgi:hypothetical protein